MKHLDGEKCFMELTKGDCLLLTEYLTHSADWYKEHNITGETYSINEYIKKFKSFYHSSQDKTIANNNHVDGTVNGSSRGRDGYKTVNNSPITIKEELDRN